MEFKLGKYSIQFDEEFLAYNDLRKEFIVLSNDLAGKFEEEYHLKFKNMDDVFKGGRALAYEVLEVGLDKAIKLLIQNNVLIVDKEIFINKYYDKYMTLEHDFEIINSKYRKIIMSEEEEKAYKEKIKNTKIRWNGNLSDTLKDSLEATYNIAQSVISTVSNFATSSSIQAKKEELFNNVTTLETLKESIKRNCFNLHYAIVDALIENGVNKYRQVVTCEQIDKSKALLNNLKAGFIPDDKKDEILEEIIKSNPYDFKIYVYLIETFGDKNSEVKNFAAFLGLDLSSDIEQLVEKYFEALANNNEEETKESIKMFNDYVERLNYTDINSYADRFAAILKNHDLNIRTVDGMIFETREEATLAKEELAKILEIKSEIVVNNEEFLTMAISKINALELKTIIKDKYLEELNKALVDAIKVADESLLNQRYPLNREFNSELEVEQAMYELNNLEIRTQELKEARLKAYAHKKDRIIEADDKKILEDYYSKFVILSEDDLEYVKEKIRNLNIRTEKLKKEKINSISRWSLAIIKKHQIQLELAAKYEQRIKALKIVKQSQEKGFLGVITKVIEKGTNFIEDIQEKSEKEAWEFITVNGKRTVDQVRSGEYKTKL